MRVRERSREEGGSVWEQRIKRGPPGRGDGGVDAITGHYI